MSEGREYQCFWSTVREGEHHGMYVSRAGEQFCGGLPRCGHSLRLGSERESGGWCLHQQRLGDHPPHVEQDL